MKQPKNLSDRVHLYTFWEGNTPPLYLRLCMETWEAHIPNLEVEIINYSNLHEYVGAYVDIAKLKRFSLAMQSDVISSIILATRGGTFIDVDTIMLPNVDIDFLRSPNGKVNVFGIPQKKVFHVAVMSAPIGNRAMLKWMNEASKRVAEAPKEFAWNYLAGNILETMIKDPQYEAMFNIIDRKESGNILEAAFGLPYTDFYFSERSPINAAEIVKRAKYGIVSLHNSWTPHEFSQMTERTSLLNKNYLLSKILSYSLKEKGIDVA